MFQFSPRALEMQFLRIKMFLVQKNHFFSLTLLCINTKNILEIKFVIVIIITET